MTPAAPDHDQPRTPKEKAVNESKQIEPTDAMVDEAANTLSLYATGTSLRFHADEVKCDYRNRVLPALRAALNHPDAAGLFAGVDDRPWGPLNGPARAGDEVRQELHGITHTGIVAYLNDHGDPRTAEGGFIGSIREGTWYVRHPAQELPTGDGAQIIPAHGVIEACLLYTSDAAAKA